MIKDVRQLKKIVLAASDVRLQAGRMSKHSAVERKKTYAPRIPASNRKSAAHRRGTGNDRRCTHREVLAGRDKGEPQSLYLEVRKRLLVI